jgi:hypothetical protein
VERRGGRRALGGGPGGQHAATGGVPGKRLRDDERLWEELSYCVPLGIPHSRFLDWDPDDQDKALAYTRDINSRCKGCGTRHEDWVEDDNAYISWHDVCPGCERLEQEKANVHEGQQGVHFRLLPKDLALHLMEQGEGGVE